MHYYLKVLRVTETNLVTKKHENKSDEFILQYIVYSMVYNEVMIQ